MVPLLRKACARFARRPSPCRIESALPGLLILGALSATALAGERVRVRLEGEVLPECLISASPQAAAASLLMPIDAGDVSAAGARDFSFTVTCNAPFGYRMEAQHGALSLGEEAGAPRGLAAAIPYEVAMHIPTDDGGAIDDRCSGESLKAGRVRCRFSGSGEAIALSSQGRLTLAWTPGPAPPAAGAYTDRLTVTIGVRQ